jgi:hypothetical protein
VAQNDEGTVRIFGKIEMNFSVLNEVQEVADQLTRAFPPFRWKKRDLIVRGTCPDQSQDPQLLWNPVAGCTALKRPHA